ncbi:STAS domain-containing protein [Bacillus weihaiensis]|uniref:STAS domain-containing protein n=1 Tax=Bacillus weihaiensis TaxID=1547283 RepID=UPI002352C199|nr:STAS domain-containing protein [Bacillus weihaiensis]
MTISSNIVVQQISAEIINKKASLAIQRYTTDLNHYSMEIDTELKSWRENLINIFAKSISDDLEQTYKHLTTWGNAGVKLLIELKLPLDVGIEEVRFYRNEIGEIIKNEAIKNNMSLSEFYTLISNFDSVVDRAVHLLSLTYSENYLSRINAAEITALELSIPVIQITEDMGVLPLVGDIDTRRSQELMERALESVSTLGLSHIFIDLSGVPIIDTMVAHHLFRVVEALKLVGVKTILSGIRPEIAQTMVQLGIEIQHLTTFSSLHKAIKYININTL